MPLDQKIVNFYISTTEGSTNRDVCYYSSYNFPAFIYVTIFSVFASTAAVIPLVEVVFGKNAK